MGSEMCIRDSTHTHTHTHTHKHTRTHARMHTNSNKNNNTHTHKRREKKRNLSISSACGHAASRDNYNCRCIDRMVSPWCNCRKLPAGVLNNAWLRRHSVAIYVDTGTLYPIAGRSTMCHSAFESLAASLLPTPLQARRVCCRRR